MSLRWHRCCLAALLALTMVQRAAAQGEPVFVVQPRDLSVRSGESATFMVSVQGDMPMEFQWFFNSSPIPGAVGPGFGIPSVHPTNGGSYHVVVTNRSGAATSDVARLSVDANLVFRIVELRTNTAIAIDGYDLVGFDLGVLAAGSNSVYLTGRGNSANNFQRASARVPAGTLSGGARITTTLYALTSNLRTEKLYSLGTGNTPITYVNTLNSTTVTSLLEIDENTGNVVGTIPLSLSIPIANSGRIGIFAGWDRIVIHGAISGSGYHVYDIALPSGTVTDHGLLSLPSHQFSDAWAYWGIAEYFEGILHLVYVRDTRTIVRRSVLTGNISELGVFENLGNMSMIAFSPSRSRWFFRHQSSSQFGSFSDTLGSAKATFTTDPGFPSVVLDPQSRQVYVESNIVLSVTAGGEQPLFYQWLLNGFALDGATNSTLGLTNVQPNQGGIYTVRIANRLGEITSGRAVLDVVSTPRILSTPSDRSVYPGTNVTFSVGTDGAPPRQYQWFFNDQPIVGAVGSVLMLTNVQPAMDGFYTLQVSNRFGVITTRRIELNVPVPVDDGSVFEILALNTNGVRAIDAYETANNNQMYGPLAAGSNGLFMSSFNNSFRFSADDLSGGGQVGSHYSALISNLRTETAYAMGNDNGPFGTSGGAASVLWELNSQNGTRTGRRVELSLPIPNIIRSSLVSYFAGYDEGVILNGSRAYRIALPSGVVTDLGPMATPSHVTSFDGPCWGVAEHFGGVIYLVFVKNTRSIVRARVPDGAEFSPWPQFINLGTMPSITVSLRRNRWYFEHRGTSQFATGNIDTLGYATAAFRIRSGASADHFDFAPIHPLQAVNSPFPVTIYARNTDNQIATNFTGDALLRGVNAANGQLVAITPLTASNFVSGVWTGMVNVGQTQPGMYLRAENAAEALLGTSDVFAVNPLNDLAVTVKDSPDPVLISSPLTYSITVTNYGPTEATGVLFSNAVPASVGVLSISATQGICTNDGGLIVCDIGTLPGGASSEITLVLVPTTAGVLSNRVYIVRGEADANPANNSVSVLSTVTLPRIAIGDTSILEGDSGSNDVTFTLTLSDPVTNTVRVNFVTQANTAAALDFVTQSGQAVFEPGVTSQVVSVAVRGDTLYEGNELFYLTLSAPSGGTLVTNRGSCTILNDDAAPLASALDTSIIEGDSGSNAMTFRVTISAAAGLPVIINYATSNGTAFAGTDYQPRFGTLTFPPNTAVLTQSVVVQIIGDTLGERDETVHLVLSSMTNASPLKPVGTGTILNNDGIGMLEHFTWATVASPQTPAQPFAVRVEARDSFDTLVTNFGGSVQLAAQIPQPGFTGTLLGDLPDAGTFSGGFYTIGYSFTPAVNMRVTHVRSYSGTKVSIWRDNGQLLAAQPVSSNPGTWTETPMLAPLQLTAGTTYRVGFYGGDETYYSGEIVPGSFLHGTVGAGVFSLNDAFPTNDLGGGTFLYFVDLRYAVDAPPLPVNSTPAEAVTFTNGVWSGFVSVLEPGSNVVLRADDGQQRSGESNPFDVVAPTDAELALVATVQPNPCRLASTIVYSIIVTNRGPADASDVVVSNNLPPGFAFISADSSQGVWANTGESVVASFGNLPAGASARCTIEAVADAPGTNVTQVRVQCSDPDPNPYNNSVRLTSVVFVDRDNDGLWDDWEQRHELRTDDPNDAALDLDSDGHNNLAEFGAGTNPRDPESVLRINRVTVSGGNVRINFRGMRGRRYRLERLDNWNGNWTTVSEFRVGTISSVDLLDTGAASHDWCLYRIRVVP
jgi:uncharacterized repeat protein (TIGR01451 family)